MSRSWLVTCPICASVLRTKRAGDVPRHAAGGRRYSRKTRCSGSGRTLK